MPPKRGLPAATATPAATKPKAAAKKGKAAADAKPAAKAKGKAAGSSKIFDGVIACISGKFSDSQATVKNKLVSNGAKVVGSVTSVCTLLVSSGVKSASYLEAEEKDLPIVTLEWLDDSIKAGKQLASQKYYLSGGSDNIDSDDAEGDAEDGENEEEEEDAEENEDEEEDEEEEEEDKPIIKTVIVKGKAPVDEHFVAKDSFHVYVGPDGVYDATLNQTNINANNNKFYIIQLLESDSKDSYIVYTRWGRVGAPGAIGQENHSNVDAAKRGFCKKFLEKTKNHWEDRADFVPVPGKYTLLERDYSVDDDDAENEDDEQAEKKRKIERKACTLNPNVKKLIELIYDTEMMKNQMMEIGYDARKLPLGKLSSTHIAKGLTVLAKLSTAAEKGNRKECERLSSEFYTLIPHDFGRSKPSIIADQLTIKNKLEMLDSLADISVAVKMLKKDLEDVDTTHPADLHYKALKCELTSVDPKDSIVDTIREYIENTHGSTHSNYSIELDQVFEVNREGEKDRFTPFEDKNRMLLWHGSRLTNFVGILSQGLRIAPPEAPVTGYMFGKGVYFADSVSKSANYCYPSRNKPSILLLCEVAVGESRELYQSDYYADKLPKGKLSTKGIGSMQPDPSGFDKLADGTIVPKGKLVNVGDNKTSLLYNEFIVYDVSQIRIRYLLRVNTKYK